MAARGLIEYYGLGHWWHEELIPEQRARLESVFHIFGNSNPRPLTEGPIERIVGPTATPAGFLADLISLLPSGPQDSELRRKIRLKLAKLAQSETDVVARHFSLHVLIGQYYRDRNGDPGCRDAAIAACREQIALAPRTAVAIRPLFRAALPGHLGFQQLAIILEKDGRFEEAIALCRCALEGGWYGDWERRIARCERRYAKANLRRQSA